MLFPRLLLLLSMPVIFSLRAGACDAKIISVSPGSICGEKGMVTVTVQLLGVPEWGISYRAGIKIYNISGIKTSQYEFQITGDGFGGWGLQRIQLLTSSDALGAGHVDTLSYYVTVRKTPEPSGDPVQEFCAAGYPVVSALAVAGSGIKWYAGAEGGPVISPNTLLSPGSYWSSQTINNCESDERFKVEAVLNDPGAPVGDAVNILCTVEPQTFSALEVSGNSIKWYNAASGGSEIPVSTVLADGTYWATRTADGCESASRLAVDVDLVSPPVPDLGPDTALCFGNNLVLGPGVFSAYLWSTGATSGTITLTEGAGSISVTVTDEKGCTGSDEIIVSPCNPEFLLGRIPNTFTPNGDGYHDTWVIENIFLFPDCSVEVYDRWGRLVFDCSDGYGNDWDGSGLNGSALPAGTYYYIIDLNVPGVKAFTGTITILR